MDLVGKIGIVMALIGGIAILVELVLIIPRALRLNSQVAVLVRLVDDLRVAMESDMQGLRSAGNETHILWKPYRRVLRWLAHPLTIAVFESYRRRRAGNGIGRQGNQSSPVDRVAG